HLGLAEGAFALVVRQDDRAQYAVTAEDGDVDDGMTLVGARHDLSSQRCLFGAAVRNKRLARLHYSEKKATWHGSPGLRHKTHTMFVFVEEVRQIGLRVVPSDADDAGVEHLTQLVPDQVDDRLEVELGGHALLDAVDHAELGGALLELRDRTMPCRE